MCVISDCVRTDIAARGLCRKHYQRWRLRDRPTSLDALGDLTTEQRFWEKVEKTATCWLWTGALQPNGYGRFQNYLAHRYAYELLVGPIPSGLTIDHVKTRGCKHRNCVNPAHLEPVTQKVNNARGVGAAVTKARHAAKTHCKLGHEFTIENTYIKPDGRRSCKACKTSRAKAKPRSPEESRAAYLRWEARGKPKRKPR